MSEEFFINEEKHYFSNSKNITIKEVSDLLPNDVTLYHIQTLTFEEKAPRKEALENVISALRFKGINFLYLLIGDELGVHFYLGAVRDLNYDRELDMSLSDIGEEILKPSINGNFRGSKINELNNEEKYFIVKKINEMKTFGSIEGVPGINEDAETFQGTDRLVDVMLGEKFIIGIMASPLDSKRIKEIENNIYDVYDRLVPLSKNSVQIGEGTSRGESITNGTTKGRNSSISESETESSGVSVSQSESSGTSTANTDGSNNSKSTQNSKSYERTSIDTTSTGSSNSNTMGTSKQNSTTDGKTNTKGITNGKSTGESSGSSFSKSENEGKNESKNISVENVKKIYVEWMKYFDDVIIKRLDYGKSKGLFVVNTFIGTNNRASLIKLGHTMNSLYAGKEGNKVPLKLFEIKNEDYLNNIKNLQVPVGKIKRLGADDILKKSALSQDISEEFIRLGNVVSTNELSLIAGLPQKEVVGLELREQIEFGLNARISNENEKIVLGKLVQGGRKLNIEVGLDKQNLNKHVFITGVTGSGKTTTCQRILLDSGMPFMVIEPAKTEYRILTEIYDDILIFTLGRDNIAPFRINPFEFYKHENISSRVDMIKATLEAAFDMEAAIPQIIESSIYECYENYGWNIATNENENFDDPFKEGVYSFPTLSDLINQVERNVKSQGFDDRMKNDYIGSIKARLQGLLVGSKGLMLNCKRSVNFKELIKRRVILELEEIKNGAEKSLLMGFVLINLNEAIKASYLEDTNFKHITLVEEAHRLLSKYEIGDSSSKKQGVEAFSDMLAEVRKYGESLIIVDQIPDKLTADVLKNTNTKIVHKIFAEDDKRAIGNTMALEKEQMEFLSNLDVGRAIVFSQGFGKAMQIQVDRLTNTTGKNIVNESIIRDKILDFYKEHYKTGVLEGLEYFETEPNREMVFKHLQFLQKENISKAIIELIEKTRSDFEFKEYMDSLDKIHNVEFLSKYISRHIYIDNKEKGINVEEKIKTMKSLLQGIIDNKINVANGGNSVSEKYLGKLRIGLKGE